jgi:tellurite resistance protein TerC
VKRARHVWTLVSGFTLLAAGAAMLVLPGPGWVTVALGLAILAKEYAWARWLLAKLKKNAKALLAAARRGGAGEAGPT